MSRSQFLSLPLIQPSQAQKHVTHNEALIRLDALLHLASETFNLNMPPSNPEDGERYIIGLEPEGAWSGHSREIAAFTDAMWHFFTPVAGWQAWVRDEESAYVFNGTDWVPFANNGSAAQELSTLGVNTAADNHNRLSVKSDSILLSHDDVTPGSGDIRLSLNKNTRDDVSSMIFQSGYQSFAEMGLTGNNDFTLNVVGDDGNYTPAMTIDHNSGEVSFPNSPALGAASSAPLETLTVLGTGGNNDTPNGLHIGVETDPFNPNTAACVIRPESPGARLIFGSSSTKFFSLNFANVTVIERMPQFSTSGGMAIGYAPTGSHLIGRTGNKVQHHSCGPSNSGHRFYANTGSYSRTGETLVLDLQQDEIALNVPAKFAAPVKLANYDLSALPDASSHGAGAMIFVTDPASTGFAAISNGTDWRRLSDSAL